ncbi:hypothetical protein PG995_005827 [Apiospora arundinis]
MPTYTRTRTGCFTCREDGYKCDEQKPHCGRCLRLGKTCKGYGVRLKWHTLETPTTTKKTSSTASRKKNRKSPGTASTITTNITSTEGNTSPVSQTSTSSSPRSLLAIKRSSSSPSPFSYVPSDISFDDRRLLDHWSSLATVISMGTSGSGGEGNPFLVHLTPMLMQSEALRAVVCSMAASHLAVLRGHDRALHTVALQQRLRAASALRQTIEFSDAEPTLAAILMLQVSDRLFATEARIDHLAGAKAVVAKKGKFADWTGSRAQFLLSLCYYHDVLSSISRGTSPLFEFDDSLPVEGLASMVELTKLLRLVSQISGMVAMRGDPDALDARGREIEAALSCVVPDPPDEVEMDAVAHTTVAYKHAAFIYLYRAWYNIGAPHPLTRVHIEKTLHHLGCVPSSAPIISAHVWPTWTAGCEAIRPGLRQFVLERFDQMYEARHFPSLLRTKSDIQDVWVVKDAQRELSGVDNVDCIKVILQQRQREADLA